MTKKIGILRETSLHADLKEWLARPGDRLEAVVEEYVIDIVRDHLLIEVQTGNFSALKSKLHALLPAYQIQVVYPVAAHKWIKRVTEEGEQVARRRSPKKGQLFDLFDELVRLPELMKHPNLSLTVILIHKEEIWCDDGQGSWRRKGWSIIDHRLLEVVEQRTFVEPQALLTLLPDHLPEPFTNRELAETAGIRPRLAQRMTYSLRQMDLLVVSGKRGRAYLHQRRQ